MLLHLLFDSLRDATSNTNILSYIYEKYIKIIYSKNTNWDKSNKIEHDYVFSYIYQLKDSQSYQVNSVNGQNVATFLGQGEYQ